MGNSCLSLCRDHSLFQVFELGLFSALRNVLIGGPAERKTIASAGTATHLKPTPGRQGAILGCWELALTVSSASVLFYPSPVFCVFCVFACLRVCGIVGVLLRSSAEELGLLLFLSLLADNDVHFPLRGGEGRSMILNAPVNQRRHRRDRFPPLHRRRVAAPCLLRQQRRPTDRGGGLGV